MRGLGRLIGKAATGAAPVALEQWRNQILQQRDAKLREYAVEDRNVTIANSNEQARLAREQQGDQFNKEYEQRKTQFEATNKLATDSAALNKQQVEKAISQIDQQLETGRLALEDAKALRDARNALVGATTPEEISAAKTKLEAYGVKFEKEQPTRIKTTDESGLENEQIGRYDSATNTFTPATTAGGASASAIPQGAIDELMKDPSPEAIAEFNQIFGAGAAERYAKNGGGKTQATGGGLLNGVVTGLPSRNTPQSRVMEPGGAGATQEAPSKNSKLKGVGWEPSTIIGREVLGSYHGRMGLNTKAELNAALKKLGDAYSKEVERAGVNTTDAKSLLKEIQAIKERIDKG